MDEIAARILLNCETSDTIEAIADRLEESRETIVDAVERLERRGFIERTGYGTIHIRDSTQAATSSADRTAEQPVSIEEAYLLPYLAELPFAFTRIDGVYIWTRGGYQVGRDPTDYPLFLAVRKADVDEWRAFFDMFGLPTGFERQLPRAYDGNLQIVLDARAELEREFHDGIPVSPQSEVRAYILKNKAQLGPALDLIISHE